MHIMNVNFVKYLMVQSTRLFADHFFFLLAYGIHRIYYASWSFVAVRSGRVAVSRPTMRSNTLDTAYLGLVTVQLLHRTFAILSLSPPSTAVMSFRSGPLFVGIVTFTLAAF